MSDPQTWDEEAAYDAEIAPLMAAIIDVCQRRKIPMVASFVYRRSADGDDFCESCLTFEGRPFREAEAFLKGTERRPFVATITNLTKTDK